MTDIYVKIECKKDQSEGDTLENAGKLEPLLSQESRDITPIRKLKPCYLNVKLVHTSRSGKLKT